MSEQIGPDKWSFEDLDEHLRINISSEYGAAVIVAALHKKIYGHFPRIGLSGFQAEGANALCDVLPDPAPSI